MNVSEYDGTNKKIEIIIYSFISTIDGKKILLKIIIIFFFFQFFFLVNGYFNKLDNLI